MDTTTGLYPARAVCVRDNEDKATKLGMETLCGCVIVHVLFELFNQQMVGHTQADTHTIRTWVERSHTQQDREHYQDMG